MEQTSGLAVSTGTSRQQRLQSYERFAEASVQCPVCVDTYQDGPILSCELCKHAFCIDCILHFAADYAVHTITGHTVVLMPTAAAIAAASGGSAWAVPPIKCPACRNPFPCSVARDISLERLASQMRMLFPLADTGPQDIEAATRTNCNEADDGRLWKRRRIIHTQQDNGSDNEPSTPPPSSPHSSVSTLDVARRATAFVRCAASFLGCGWRGLADGRWLHEQEHCKFAGEISAIRHLEMRETLVNIQKMQVQQALPVLQQLVRRFTAVYDRMRSYHNGHDYVFSVDKQTLRLRTAATPGGRLGKGVPRKLFTEPEDPHECDDTAVQVSVGGATFSVRMTRNDSTDNAYDLHITMDASAHAHCTGDLEAGQTTGQIMRMYGFVYVMSDPPLLQGGAAVSGSCLVSAAPETTLGFGLKNFCDGAIREFDIVFSQTQKSCVLSNFLTGRAATQLCQDTPGRAFLYVTFHLPGQSWDTFLRTSSSLLELYKQTRISGSAEPREERGALDRDDDDDDDDDDCVFKQSDGDIREFVQMYKMGVRMEQSLKGHEAVPTGIAVLEEPGRADSAGALQRPASFYIPPIAQRP